MIKNDHLQQQQQQQKQQQQSTSKSQSSQQPQQKKQQQKEMQQRQQRERKAEEETEGDSAQKEQPKQQKRRQLISQAKMPIEESIKRETEAFQQKAAPSVDARRLVQLDNNTSISNRCRAQQLSKTFTALNTCAVSSSTGFGQQRCSDGTFRSPTPIFRRQPRHHHRSNSIDSDLNDFGPTATATDVVGFGILTRSTNRTKSRERDKWSFSWRVPKSTDASNNRHKFACGTLSSMDMTAMRLPLLDGFCPGRTSCQLQHVSRSHFELIKYKRTLNS